VLSPIDRPTRLVMHLTDHDPRQLDPDALSRLGEGALRRLAERLLANRKEARDRLNQNSRNSSRPPGSDSVYRQARGGSDHEPPAEPASEQTPDGALPAAADEAEKAADPSDASAPVAKQSSGVTAPAARRPGRQPGAPGVGREPRSRPSTPYATIGQSSAPCVANGSRASRLAPPTAAPTKLNG